jgi:citrate synthase
LLNKALVLLADHELATSTLAVRIAISAQVPLTNALMAGLATLGGAAHADAATEVHLALLTHDSAAGRSGATTSGAGFGHQVHLHGDPRTQPLLAEIRQLATPRQRTAIDDLLRAGEAAGPPNVDFALGSLCYAARMRPGAAQGIFAVARSAGWIAHAAEESAERPLRFRTRAVARATDKPTAAP